MLLLNFLALGMIAPVHLHLCTCICTPALVSVLYICGSLSLTDFHPLSPACALHHVHAHVIAAPRSRSHEPANVPNVLWASNVVGSTTNASFGTPTPFFANNITGVLVLGGDENTLHTSLFCFDAATGHVRWNLSMPFVESASGWVAVGQNSSGATLAFAGTREGVVAVDIATGRTMWRYRSPQHNDVSAHPTYFGGKIYVAFEDGNASAPLAVVDATTGAQLALLERAFTKVWALPLQSLVVYIAFQPNPPPGTTGISLIARELSDQQLRWRVDNLFSTELNNNPNLDVDDLGNGVYMYSRYNDTLRYITLFDSATGAMQWNFSTVGPVADYDTFAWDGYYYQIVSQYSQTSFLVEKISSQDARRVWVSEVVCSDMNAILLVGGGGVFLFAPDTNQVIAISSDSGTPLWTYDITGPWDGETYGNALYFGDSTGTFHALCVSSQCTTGR